MVDKGKLLVILKDACPDIDFENENALIDDGLLDSFDIVTIVSDVVDAFGVKINVDDLEPENFNSMNAIAELIESKQ